MAVDLGSTFKELIDEINSKSAIDSIDGLKGGTLSSPLIITGGDKATAAKIALIRAGKGQITDENTRTVFGFMSEETLTVGTDYYVTNIRGRANSAIGGKKFSDLAVKSDIPDTSNLVTTNTAQTISGTKTFTSGSIVASKTDSSNKTMKVAYGPNGIAYTPYGTTSIHLISFPAKDGTFALTSDIPSLTNYVTTNTAQTISGVKTFNAPTNVSGKETITTKFKTSNGGALIIGKEGQNSGTMLRFDQVDGTCRLRFRSSATAGSMVWEQPEKNAALYFDMGNSAGSGVNRVTLRNVAGTLALTKELPAAVSANPTLSGSETELTSIKIGDTTYKVVDVTLAGDNTFTGNNSFTNGIKIVTSSNTAMTYKRGSIEYLYNGEIFTLTLPVKDGIVATRDEIHNHSEQIISNFGIKGTAYNLSQSNIADSTTAALVLGGTAAGSTTTTYKVGAIANKGVTLTLPTTAGTLATQEYVTTQIGNIDTLLTAINTGTGV